MSPIKPTTTVSSVGSQKDNRYLDTFYDQHKSPRFAEGRPWHGYREFAANKGQRDGFCTDLSPGRHTQRDEKGQEMEDPRAAWATVWHAPWMPEQRFFDFNYLRGTFRIRYDHIIGHDTAFYDKHYEAAMRIANENSWPEVEYGGVLRRGIRAIIGDWPRSPKIAEAAQAGDPWLLGFNEEVNVELALLLGRSKHGIPLRVEREPLVSAEAVLSVPQSELAAMIAAEIAKAKAGWDAEAAKKKDAQKASMANARSKRRPTNSLPAAG